MATIHLYLASTNHQSTNITATTPAACFAIILSVSGTVFHVFPLWLIFISLLMRSCAQTFQMPTIQSVMPTMVPDKEITRMNGQLGMVQSANMIIAPALGAFLFAFIPIEYLILLDVLGAIIGICILTWVQISNNEKIDQPMHVLHNTRLGIKQLTNNKGLWYITLIGAVFTLTYMLIGGTIIGLFGKWQDRMKPVIIAFFLVGIPTGISGILPGNQTGFLWFAALNIIEGIATPFFTTLLMAMIQQSYPAEELGRILGVLNSLLNLAGPIGLIFAGPLADVIGIERLFVIAGIGAAICGVVAVLMPITRQYDIRLHQKLAKLTEQPDK
ncbi:MFS transporter [Secundilactobacillus sp. HBUAS58055]|uniref:MFS transporter n=1 Tax=Secundilactobacillus angelensis TaxID=2722706 RepID=UPI001E54158F|nr:MFS transporter [Secundilactobacillus angelensis]MCH5463457.1 MFS transporter [Secundilactobacillus angelensis]